MSQVEQQSLESNPLPNHPGVNSTGQRRAAESFEGFQLFVNTRGLKPVTTQTFNDLLAELFEQTGNHWIPGFCMFAIDVTARARELARLHMPDSCIATMLHLDQLNTHTWTRLEVAKQPALVIDPVGVINRESRILPYFGPISPCIVRGTRFATAEKVYRNSTPLTPIQEAKIAAANKIYF